MSSGRRSREDRLVLAPAGADLVAALRAPIGDRPANTSAEGRTNRGRVGLVMAAFAGCFAVLAFRLFLLALIPVEVSGPQAVAAVIPDTQRPTITDRNGEILATDIAVASLYAEPKKIQNPAEAAALLAQALPEFDRSALEVRLSGDRAFTWLKRELTPRQQHVVHNLGVPGIGFRDYEKRVYPNGHVGSHLLGHVDVDNRGVAGIEKHIDDAVLGTGAGRPVALSIDLRVQHALRSELAEAMDEFAANAAAGIVMNARTGEIMAMSSLPDFDPNSPPAPTDPSRFNRATLGVYEMGSIFKAFTTAMALDSGKVSITDTYDATKPIKVSRFTIRDFHAEKRPLTVPEIFMHSSNIGSAKMALAVGREDHRAFMGRLGFLDRSVIELPETSRPLTPDRWTDLSTMTISFGHGLSVTPLHVVRAAGAMVNGGILVEPTLLRRDAGDGEPLGPRVISEETSAAVQALMRLVVAEGTGRNADVPGYPVLGKTGTAEKPGRGGYLRKALLTSFLGAFPAGNPQYVTLVLLDEPHATKKTSGYATAGWNAAPLTARVVKRIAPLLGVEPVGGPAEPSAEILSVAYR